MLSDHFGRPVPLVLVVDDGAPAAATRHGHGAPPPIDEPVEEIVDVHELEDAPPDNRSDVDRIAAAFPGAELVRGGKAMT